MAASSVGIRNSRPLQRNLIDFVEENGSKNVMKAFTYKHIVCHACCGFYGPCFDQPLCATCHAFLCPADINQPDGALLFQEKSDSEDSGNEEPTDFYETVQLVPQPRRPQVNLSSSAKDKLSECISALTCPRKKEPIPEALVESLPVEVLTVLFSFLDDLTLWTCGQVCKRWCQVLERMTNDEQWRRHVLQRWPLFKPHCTISCWRTLYTRLLDSSPCLLCLHQLLNENHPMPAESSWRTTRLQHELKSLQSDPPEGIEALPLDRGYCHWQACINGPEDSPYEGGRFFLYLQIPQGYPMRPPVVRFITKIFHPNVSRHGDIGLDSIHHNWSLALTISKVLISIQSLLTDPFCHVCMEPEVGKLYTEDRSTFDYTAWLWTNVYAMHHRRSTASHAETVWQPLGSG